MTSLLHWDYATKFSARQASALIAGFEPDDAWQADSASLKTVRVVHDRMQGDFQEAVRRFKAERLRLPVGRSNGAMASARGRLVSIVLVEKAQVPKNSTEQYLSMAAAYGLDKLDEQQFAREQLLAWLRSNELPSAYDFDEPSRRVTTLAAPEPLPDIDPSDLPEELQAANIAYRAVHNGFGDATTFKARLVQYLEAKFAFSDEAVQRIATVANPDKSAGRRKRSA